MGRNLIIRTIKHQTPLLEGGDASRLPAFKIPDDEHYRENTRNLASQANLQRENSIKKNILDGPKSLTQYPSNIDRTLSIIPANQSGHICKITALSNIDLYYSNYYSISNIPSRKNHKSIYESELNCFTNTKEVKNSIRKISKSYGSKQGEVLRFEDLRKTAVEMGYLTTQIAPKNSEDFFNHIAEQLLNSKPVVAFFAVEKDNSIKRGLPTKIYDDNEHACLIVGINTENKTLVIAHWGALFRDIPMEDFYQSMQSLPKTREPEIYKKIDHDAGTKKIKYEPASESDAGFHKDSLLEPSNDINKEIYIKSLTPEENSGFHNRMLVLSPDLSNQRWQQQITDKTIPYRSKNGFPEVALNCRVSVDSMGTDPNAESLTDPSIVCRHLALLFAKHGGKKRELMHAFSNYAGLKSQFEGSLKPLEAEFNRLMKDTPQSNRHVVSDDRFGFYLEALANALQGATEKTENRSSVNCLLLTGNHAMALHVEKKNKNQRDYFSVKLYDPNTTANFLRVERAMPEDLRSLKIKDLFLNPQCINDYNDSKGDTQSLSTMAFSLDPLVKPIFDRKPTMPTPANMFLALSYGSLDDFNEMADTVNQSKLSNSEKVELYNAKSNTSKITGLQDAFYQGNTEMVNAYTIKIEELRKSVGDRVQRASISALLFSRPIDNSIYNFPGLHAAIYFGHTKTAKIYIDRCLTLKLNPLTIKSILESRFNGTPGMHTAFKKNLIKIIKNTTEAVLLAKTINKKIKFEVLQAMSKDGKPGFSLPFESGHTPMVTMFTDLILSSELPHPRKIKLLSAKSKSEETGAQLAIKNGHTGTVEAFKIALVNSKKFTIEEIDEILSITPNGA